MKRSKVLLGALCALLLAGCSLARPVRTPEEETGDRWVGLYLVREDGRGGFYDNPDLVEYGESPVELEGYGNFMIENQVLFAEEIDNQYIFPGVKGYSIYILSGTYADGSGEYVKAVCDMAPSEELTEAVFTDGGTSHTISGTLYVGPPLGKEDWDAYEDRSIWTAYRVYQAPDGRPYLDGSGNSFSGGMSSYSENQTYSYTENGETVQEDTISVTVSVKEAPRLERLVVTQFDENNAIARSEDLALREELPEVVCEPETAWVLVEEVSGDSTKRTVYNVPGEGEEPVSHMVVLLDDEGLGKLAYLTLRR